MRVSDLTDEDIGRSLWVKGSMSANWVRVCFEGLTTRALSSDPERDGGHAYWTILMCTPTPGAMHFRTPSGRVFTGLLVRRDAEIWPVVIDYAVSSDGEIVELGEHAA